MNKKIRFVIFLAITAINNNNICMEAQEAHYLKQLLVVNTDNNCKTLKNILKENIVDNHSTIHRALQYEMLRTCIANNNMRSLAICLENKFNPNRYHKGLSLLHYSVQHNNAQAIQHLVAANPDLTPLLIVNDKEETPLDYALRFDYKECSFELASAIALKHNNLIVYKEHCGLIKHIIQPERPCSKCIEELASQLKKYKLSSY
jgi:hypothetical protein